MSKFKKADNVFVISEGFLSADAGSLLDPLKTTPITAIESFFYFVLGAIRAECKENAACYP